MNELLNICRVRDNSKTFSPLDFSMGCLVGVISVELGWFRWVISVEWGWGVIEKRSHWTAPGNGQFSPQSYFQILYKQTLEWFFFPLAFPIFQMFMKYPTSTYVSNVFWNIVRLMTYNKRYTQRTLTLMPCTFSICFQLLLWISNLFYKTIKN